MKIREKVPISTLTTMRLGGEARYVLEIESLADIAEAYDFAAQKNLPTWMMGGGANTLGRDAGFDGVIILNKLHGIEVIDKDDNILKLRGVGGEIWDDLVQYACDLGYSGIEAMSLIPGTVGAAPVQNIGAYGQDVAQVIESVEAYDRQAKTFVTLPKPELQMGYRHTRLNHGQDKGRFFITAVTMILQKSYMQPPFYNSLQRYIDEHQETDFAPQNIRRIVCEIRNQKLPDPAKIASAGSFFKNIYLDKTAADQAEAQKIPLWRDLDGNGKINSGWLVEQCGFKGKLLHGIRVSDKAALVLINESAESFADLALARDEIIDAVAEKYHYKLEQEPVEIE